MRTVSECRKKKTKERKSAYRLSNSDVKNQPMGSRLLQSIRLVCKTSPSHLKSRQGPQIGEKKDPQFLIFPIEALQVKVFTGGSSAAHTHMYETHKHTHSTLLPLFVLWNSLSQFSDSQRILLHTLFSRLLSVTSEGHSCVCRSIL